MRTTSRRFREAFNLGPEGEQVTELHIASSFTTQKHHMHHREYHAVSKRLVLSFSKVEHRDPNEFVVSVPILGSILSTIDEATYHECVVFCQVYIALPIGVRERRELWSW